MKTFKLVMIFVLLGFYTLGEAQSSIDEQIEAIKNASSTKERVELMNHFKTTVTNLTQQQRQEAINQLRGSIQHQNTQTQTPLMPDEAKKLQLQQRGQIEQMKNTQLLEQTQQMHQQQGVKQALEQGVISPKKIQNGFMGKR